MSSEIIPVNTRTAARRAFIRTTAQALSTSIPTGAVTGAALSGADPAVIGWAITAAALSSLAAGTAAFLSIISKGVPEDYQATDVAA